MAEPRLSDQMELEAPKSPLRSLVLGDEFRLSQPRAVKIVGAR